MHVWLLDSTFIYFKVGMKDWRNDRGILTSKKGSSSTAKKCISSWLLKAKALIKPIYYLITNLWKKSVLLNTYRGLEKLQWNTKLRKIWKKNWVKLRILGTQRKLRPWKKQCIFDSFCSSIDVMGNWPWSLKSKANQHKLPKVEQCI